VGVHDGHNEDVAGLNGVKHSVWENSHQAATDIFLKNWPSMWGLLHGLYCCLYGDEKPFTKACLLFFIVENGIFKF
jgi:hypothetical protein